MVFGFAEDKSNHLLHRGLQAKMLIVIQITSFLVGNAQGHPIIGSNLKSKVIIQFSELKSTMLLNENMNFLVVFHHHPLTLIIMIGHVTLPRNIFVCRS